MSQLINRFVDRALHQPANDFKSRQGKRIRAAMVQLSFEMAGGCGRVPSVIEEAIECLHAGSLVIDDVQDNSLFRRGEPTLHQVIGMPLAVNAGNWMYFRALELLTTAALPAAQQSRLVAAMVTAGRRCHEGQAIDLFARVDQIPTAIWKETVAAISTLKTGVLMELAVAMGCIAADASNGSLAAMTSFGCQIGVALQMRNDLDELYKVVNDPIDPITGGCVRDDDLRNARVTWPWVWALELAGESRSSWLVEGLGLSSRELQVVAAELLSITQIHGANVISDFISKQVRLLSEHIVDTQLLKRMRECLLLIELPRAKYASSATKPSDANNLLSTSAGSQR